MWHAASSSLEDVSHGEAGSFMPFVEDGVLTRLEAAVRGQPDAVSRVLEDRLYDRRSLVAEAGLLNGRLADVDRVVVVAGGSALHAGLLGCHALEAWARVAARAEIASEWNDGAAVVGQRTLVVGLAPHYDATDTLLALSRARAAGARTLAVADDGISVEGPALRTGSDNGPIGTFTSHAALLLLLALGLGEARKTISRSLAARTESGLASLPSGMKAILADAAVVDEIADRQQGARFFFFLGRQAGLAVCLEGARGVRVISRIPTEALAAGEMKHGPIALIDEGTPVVCVVTRGTVHDKVISNMEEAHARGARVIAVAGEGDEAVVPAADDIVFVPRGEPLVQSIGAVLPLQLLACRLASLRHEHGLLPAPAPALEAV